jgi:cobalt/nickel transport system permease protein
MRHNLFVSYSHLGSPVHRAHAGLKLTVALAVVTTVVVAPPSVTPLFVTLALFLVLTAAASRIPPLFLLKRVLLLEPFVLGVAVLALFQPDGLRVFVAIVVKSTLSLFTMILLSNTTPFTKLLRLLRKLRVPALLLTTLALMNRYLFVLAEETEHMQRARAGRTFTRRRGQVWQSAASVAGQLFVRSSERAERIYAAMCARGWK